MKTNQTAACFAVALISAVTAADGVLAAEISKSDNREPLSSDASWQGGAAPGAGDVALWDGATAVTKPFTYGLGSDVTWQGLRMTNLTIGTEMTITNDGHTLNIGASGVLLDKDGGNVFHLYAPLNLTADQTWTKPIRVGGGINVFGAVSGNRHLILQNTMFSFYEPVAFSKLTVDCYRLNLRTNAAVTGGIFVNPGADLTLMKPADTDWADTFPGRVVTNNGIFSFGRVEGTPLVSVSMKPGDRMVTTAGAGHDSRVEVKDNRLVMDGGDLAVNWIYLRSGSVTQLSGRVDLEYSLYAGYGGPLTDTNRIVSLQGGSFEARRRIHIGDATSPDYPGIVEIGGSEVDLSKLLWLTTDNGLEMAAVRAVSDDYFSQRSANPAGILKMTGGRLRTPEVSFGSMRISRDASWNVTNGYARVELAGGELTVGNRGFGPTEVWNRPAAGALPETAQSWYNVILSGGTLGAYGTCTNYARMRLSDAHGGTLFRAADTNGTAQTIVQTQPLTGSGGLRKAGAGALEIAAACTYKGNTVVEEGTLRLKADALWADAPPAALPQPRAVWQADTLSGSFGDTVDTWPSTNGTWTFTLAGATGTWPWITPPTVGETMNGRRTVAFNGTSSAMYLTGTKETPEEGATSLTVAVVLRARGPGKRSADGDWRNSSGVIGATCSFVVNKWGIGLNSYGRAGAGITSRTVSSGTVAATAWAAPRDLHDGEAHVLMYVWSGDSNIVMNADGWRTSQYTAPGQLSDPRVRGRYMIGSIDNQTTPMCFHGDIAELRLYRTAFTPEQQRTLGLELAGKYGADTAGYLTGEQLAVGSLASTNVTVAADATLQAADAGTRVRPGQVFCGAGTVSGNLIVGAGGVIQATTNETLTVAALTFEDGGVCRWPWTAAGTPLAVAAGDLTLPQGTVTLDLGATGEKPTPRGAFLSYTGDLTDNGVTWNIVGGGGTTSVSYSEVSKTFYLSTPTGTIISVW